MAKISTVHGNQETPLVWPDVFEHQKTTGPSRLAITTRESYVDLLPDLMTCVPGDLYVLYVLRVRRGSHTCGRYESPRLDHVTVASFLTRFTEFLEGDGRHNVWIGSIDNEGLLVYDHHNIVYAYGPLDCYRTILTSRDFAEAKIKIPSPHAHHYNAEFDDAERELLTQWSWRHLPLEQADGSFE